MIEMSVPITSSKLAGARHQSSLTCSAATPRHRLVEGASGSCFAIWMGPSATGVTSQSTRCEFVLSFGYPADPAALTWPKRQGRKPVDAIVHRERW